MPKSGIQKPKQEMIGPFIFKNGLILCKKFHDTKYKFSFDKVNPLYHRLVLIDDLQAFPCFRANNTLKSSNPHFINQNQRVIKKNCTNLG